MNFWDKVLRLLGTNRVRLAWRWRAFKERSGKENFGKSKPAEPVGRRPGAGLIPEGFPLATVLILGVCLVFYFLTVQLTNDMSDERGINPSPFALGKFGAAYTPLIFEGGEWFRLFAAVFLHGGLMHIIMNSMSLWTLGNSVERSCSAAGACW
jgi:membrane associated rhomboid family serine protease